jgi:hypothetical protein
MERPILVLGYPVEHGPVDPGYGRPGGGGGHPDQGLPGRPPHVDNGHPWLGGGHIDNSLPVPPLPPTLNPPPAQVWPPVAPVFPATPEHPIAAPPGSIWPPLPPLGASGETLLVLVYITGLGWRWTVIDPSLSAGHPIAPTPEPR